MVDFLQNLDVVFVRLLHARVPVVYFLVPVDVFVHHVHLVFVRQSPRPDAVLGRVSLSLLRQVRPRLFRLPLTVEESAFNCCCLTASRLRRLLCVQCACRRPMVRLDLMTILVTVLILMTLLFVMLLVIVVADFLQL